MREIKFRAWHPKGGDDPLLADGDMLYFEQLEENHEMYIPPGYIEIMQCTGLRDMHGESIYEGDIVKMNGGAEDVYFAVSFENGCFIAEISWVDGKEIHYPELKAYIGWKFIPIYEVVGNIWENPGLLETEQTPHEG